MHKSAFTLVLCTTLVSTGCGGGGDGDTSLELAWTFESGDCASNGVETVRVTWGPQGGTTQDVEFPCGDGSGTIGNVGESGNYSIDAEGLDASGVAVVESFGASTSFSGAVPGGHVVDITLHPKGVDVVVSWSVAGGGGCPQGVVIPYYITIYEAPGTAGGEVTPVVPEVQESCSAGQATLKNVPPGDYSVEIDSRAITPAVSGAALVTVEAGQDAQVSVQL